MRVLLPIALRGFIQVVPVNVSAYLVACIAAAGSRAPLRLWVLLFLSSWTISAIWWTNAGAAKSGQRGAAVCYATGAAVGTITGLALTRWVLAS